MKWILNSMSLFAAVLLIVGCSESSPPPPERPRAVRFLETFLTEKTQTRIAADTNYYIIIAPEQCISCYAYYVVRLIKFADRHHPFFVIALEEQTGEVKKYVPDTQLPFISNYQGDLLKGQLFLRSGLAFATTANGQVLNVDVINAETIVKY